MDDADAFSRMYERDSERVLLFLARRTLDADVAVELTAERFALALSSWRRLRELTPEQARAWLFTVARRLYGRYLRTADSSLSSHHWPDALQASGLPSAELCCACRDLSCVDQRGTSACLDTLRSHLPAPTP